MIKQWFHRARAYYQSSAIILMYHRVDRPGNDPWQLSVSPAHFEEHLRIIQEKWKPISLVNLAKCVASRSIPDRSIAVTFDDGYIDNFNHAKPLLEQYKIPATFFITTQNCQRQSLFWWDELQAILLDTQQLPQHIVLTIKNETVTLDLGGESYLTPELKGKHRTWTWNETSEPPTRRSSMYLDVWQRLKPLPHAEQQAVISQLRRVSNRQVITDSELICMTPYHIRELLANPLFDIGAHTVTHPALACWSAEVQNREVTDSRAFLESTLQKPIKLFAYPYGSFNDVTVSILRKENFEVGVTTSEGLVTKRSQSLRLNRCQVNDWNGDEFNQKLSQWRNN